MMEFSNLIYKINHDYGEFSERIIVNENIIDIISPVLTRFEPLLKPTITAILFNDKYMFDVYTNIKERGLDAELVDFKISNKGVSFHDVICENCYLIANMDFGYRIIYNHEYEPIMKVKAGGNYD